MKNTPEILALEWIKQAHPRLYRAMRLKRPDIIQAAYAKPLNGLGSVDGIFDDILGFAKEAIPIYQQQRVFSAQLKQASRGQTPAPAPIQYEPAPRVIPTEYGLKVTGTPPKKGFEFKPWMIGVAVAGVGALILILRRKKGR